MAGSMNSEAGRACRTNSQKVDLSSRGGLWSGRGTATREKIAASQTIVDLIEPS
jgi:hypothetical protein